MQNLLQIIEGCHRHNRQSQRSFYERYYAYSLRIAFRYLDSYEEAVELTNDTFLQIFRNFSHFRQVGKNNAHPFAQSIYKSLFGERDPVAHGYADIEAASEGWRDHRRQPQPVMPPSSGITVPVMYAPALEARNTARPATSSGRPIRPSGT